MGRAAHVCVGADLGGSIDPVTFSKSLAAQLARRFPAFARTLRELHDPTTSYTVTQQAGTNMGQMIALNIEAFVVNASNARDTFNRLVRDPLVEVARSCPGLQAWILVDGLDEALDFPAPNIVTLLAGAGDLPEGVRFLLTSRNNPGVLDRLPGARRLNLSDPAYQALNVADLRDYVRRRLSRMGAPAGAEEAIVEAAAGNFLYVTFLLDEIASGRRSPAELGGLPPGLFGLYRGYLHRLVPDGDFLGTGDAWVLLVHFTRPVEAYSVLAYGQSSRPASPHGTDQISISAERKLRPVFFRREDSELNAERRYRP